MEGRAAILVDGTPFALIAPAVWAQFFHSPEDYYERSHIATFIRLIRLLAMTFSLTLPAIYIAFTSFHPEMLPTTLALAIAAARSRVPFSLFLETLIMETMVEVLREASVRLPGPIGPTIGIVGGLVLGDAAGGWLVSPDGHSCSHYRHWLLCLPQLQWCHILPHPALSPDVFGRHLRFLWDYHRLNPHRHPCGFPAFPGGTLPCPLCPLPPGGAEGCHFTPALALFLAATDGNKAPRYRTHAQAPGKKQGRGKTRP